MASTRPTRRAIRGVYRQTLLLLTLALACLAWVFASTGAAHASPALPVQDVAGGPQLFEVFNELSGLSLASSQDLGAWAGPDGSGAWDGAIWYGGASSVAIVISTSAGNTNNFGIYRDVATGNGKLTLHGSLTGNEMLGPVFDAEYLHGDGAGAGDATGEASPVGFWLASQGKGGTNTFHGESELDRNASFGHLSSYHFGNSVSILTDQGALELSNAHLIAWEDWTDADYDDLIVLVGEAGVVPVPEPATGWLLGLGLALALHRRR